VNSKAHVYRIVFVQLAFTVLAALMLLLHSVEVAYSVLLGGLTCVIPSAFMAWRIGRETADPSKALKSLVRGEIGKLLLTAAIFTAVFLWIESLQVAYFFIAIVVVMLLNIFVPLFEVLGRSSK
jgi:ATP synthase protein I